MREFSQIVPVFDENLDYANSLLYKNVMINKIRIVRIGFSDSGPHFNFYTNPGEIMSKFFIFLLPLFLQATTTTLNDQILIAKPLSEYESVIIYQFGKVGSSSLFHFFSPLIKTIHTHESLQTLEILDTNPNKKFLIISLVRNIFDRNISCLFEWVKVGIVPNIPKKYDLNDLLFNFNDFNDNQNQKIIKNWFSNFNFILNINIFEEPFDFEKKYYFNEFSKFDVLIMRYEDIDYWPLILQSLFNLTNVAIPSINININPLANQFRKIYRYSNEVADEMLAIDYMLFFYTEEERAGLKKKHTEY